LVFVDTIDCLTARRALVLDAQCMQKPVVSPLVRVFVQRALSLRSDTAADLDERITDLVRRFDLSAREAGLLGAVLHGISEKEYACARGISINTCKTYARRALAKIGALSLGDVRDGVLRSLNRQDVTPRG
jgi:FixJ family two-component response regulator